MNKTDKVVLVALYKLRQQVSTAFLYEQVSRKVRISLAELGARVADLERRGYLRSEPAGLRTVLVSLTGAGADFAAAAQDPRRGLMQAVGLAVIAGVILIGFLGFTNHWAGWLIPFTSLQKSTAGEEVGLNPPRGTVVAMVNTAPTVPPSATPAPTLTSTAIVQTLMRATSPDRMGDLNVNVSILMPLIQPVTSPVDESFNQAVQDYAQAQQYEPRQWLRSPVPDPGGFLDIDYVFLSEADWTAGENFPYFDGSAPATTLRQAALDGNHDVLSVLFKEMSYFGGAHPGTFFETINWDFTTGRRLSLGDLFLPNQPYLTVISDYSQVSSADPKNYQVWGITQRGLAIVFGECQMAPCAYGAKFILVPYQVIGGMIDPQGPLGRYVGGR